MSVKHSTGVSKTRDVPLVYTIYPEKGKAVDDKVTPLVCSHGLFGHRIDIGAVSEQLSNKGRKIVAYDIRNHGDSGRSPDLEVELMADDLNGLLADLKFKQPFVMGHSVSSKATMWHALNRPETIRGLVVLDAVPGKSPGTEDAKRVALLQKSVTIPDKASLAEASKDVEKQLKSTISDPEILEQIVSTLRLDSSGKVIWSTNEDAVLKGVENLFDFPAHRGKPFDKPTLFVFGEKSEHYAATDFKRLKELFPNSETKVVPGAGHYVNHDNPTAVATFVNEFFQSLESKK